MPLKPNLFLTILFVAPSFANLSPLVFPMPPLIWPPVATMKSSLFSTILQDSNQATFPEPAVIVPSSILSSRHIATLLLPVLPICLSGRFLIPGPMLYYCFQTMSINLPMLSTDKR
jgi:hypothetical protein